MSVILEIPDGNPWYLSPDIWTVPGDDPLGAPGLPIAGSNCFLWARVRNNGSDGVQNATVRFYWANPSVGVDRNTATMIGTAFVSLGPGDVQDVLCLTPWVPTFVNGGHECVLAEAFHVVDPLPAGPDFQVPSDRHVAQRNLSVVMVAAEKSFHFSFEIHNAERRQRTFTLKVEQASPATLKALLPRLGKDFHVPAKGGELEKMGFVASPCPGTRERDNAKADPGPIRVPPGGRAGLSLVGQLKGEGALLNVVQRADGREVGGLSVLVINASAKEKK